MSIRPLLSQPSELGHQSETSNSSPRSLVASAPDVRQRILVVLAFFVAGLLALVATRASGQNANFPYDTIPMLERLQDEAFVKKLQSGWKKFTCSRCGDNFRALRALVSHDDKTVCCACAAGKKENNS